MSCRHPRPARLRWIATGHPVQPTFVGLAIAHGGNEVNVSTSIMPADTKRSKDVKDEVASRLAEMPPGALRDWFAVNLRAAIVERGFRLVEEEALADEEGGIVLHVVDAEKPRSFRRKNL